MLPLAIQFLIAIVAHAINAQMARRVDYLLEEFGVLREVYTQATGRKRIAFTDEQRRRLAIKDKALTSDDRMLCCKLVRPETILLWFRRLVAQRYDPTRGTASDAGTDAGYMDAPADGSGVADGSG